MKATRHHLKHYDLVAMYDKYMETLDKEIAAKSVGVAYTTALGNLNTLTHMLAGGDVDRKRTADQFRLAVRTIKERDKSEVIEDKGVIVNTPPESQEEKLNRLFEDLKVALVDYAISRCQESFKKGNIVDFLNQRLNTLK